MMTLTEATWRAAVIGRWAARISGTLMVLFVLSFVVGEGPPSIARLTPMERWFSLGFAAMLLGLVVAWFREGWGGLVSVAGWLLILALGGRAPWRLPFLLPACVGALHLLCWWRLRGPAPAMEPFNASRFRLLFTFLWTVLGIFVLLCANEMFGMPPLMTPRLRPSDGVAGAWRDGVVAFTVGPGGAVSGTVGDAVIMDARFTRNRSWFGQFMNWRTDYLIQGRLSPGGRFTAPLHRHGTGLAGSLFHSPHRSQLLDLKRL